MIRMVQSTSANHAKAYFTDALSKSDYYIDDQELAGRLEGRLAERLKLGSEVGKDLFFDLCENKNPVTGERLTPMTKQERTVGYDINFHCPKSVSILHALSKDNHIAEAFQASVNEVMKAIEADCQTRVRKDGLAENRATDELVWAEFLHQTARPVDGAAPDPHLHIHAYVFNMTWDKEEERIKAAQFRDIKRDMPYYQALFHKTFSDKLMNQGYGIRKTAKSFEIAGVPQKAIDLFSKRTNEIGVYAKSKGIKDPKKLDELGALTRSKKQKGMSMSELKSLWRKQILDAGTMLAEEQREAVRFSKEGKPRISEFDCVDYAIQHSFERASVIGERRLLESALRHGIGDDRTTCGHIHEVVANDKRLIKVKDRGRVSLTTQEVLKEEREMVELAKQVKGQIKPLFWAAPKVDLEGQQKDAVIDILTTSHRVSIVMGAAGTGKTKLLKTAEKFINMTGKKVIVVAPTAEASKGVLVNDGFKDANTVAKLLTDKKMQNDIKEQVLWVDEAGMLGTKDMTSLLKLVKDKKAQLILGGDTRQHSSVIRGDALRILNTVAGIKAAEVSKNHRQKTHNYRTAVEDLSQGKVASAFDLLSNMGAIQEVNPLKPNDELVKDYIKLIKKGKSALVVSPTHEQGDNVTASIRATMKVEGLLSKKELSAIRYTNLNMTEAQKRDWRNFNKGQVVQFNQNFKKVKRGSLWIVSNADSNDVTIINKNGDERTLPKSMANSYDVLEMSALRIARGDKIKITRNGFDQKKNRMNNGQTMKVVSVSSNGKMKLRNEVSKKLYEIDREFGHLNHAHCVTSHGAQGKTVDHVLISQPSGTFKATDARQFYVSVSRGRESVRIYTDDTKALLDYASQLGNRESAIELVRKDKSHFDHVLDDYRKEYSLPSPTKEKEKQFQINKQFTKDYEPGF